VRESLAAADFLALQEIFPSETSPFADVLLPGVSFAEKSGTFTNTERRVQPVRKAIQPLAEARPDWEIIADIARRILADNPERVKFPGEFAGWEYDGTAAVLHEINAMTPSYRGITSERLERGEALQWPCPDPDHPGTPILHVGKFTRGLGRFMSIEHVPPAEEPSPEYPLVLTTGRVLYHWHGGEMTRRSSGLLHAYPEPKVEVNGSDARGLGLADEGRIRVKSRRGSIEARAWITDRVPPGLVFANFHFPEASANELTISALDPESKIPEYKVAAVRIEPVD
jgi:formate dehydrogenase major subunit/formate dehydrogenase alpha subunit